MNCDLHSTIPSFVRRNNKLNPRLQACFHRNFTQFGIHPDSEPGHLNFASLFGNTNDIILEIGFGLGKSLITMAQEKPDHNFIGVEVYHRGIAQILSGIEQHNVKNVRLFYGDGKTFLQNSVPQKSLAGIQIFFADPWPKNRHHKRRLIQPELVALMKEKLKIGGYLHLATDWEDYAVHMMRVLSKEDGFQNKAGALNFLAEPPPRPATKYEMRGSKLGHQVFDLYFYREK